LGTLVGSKDPIPEATDNPESIVAMRKRGFTQAFALRGGFDAWKSAVSATEQK
jgi:hypothetical protein